MPSQQRLGLDQQQGMAPLAMEAREQHEQASLVDAKGRALDGARGDDELLPKKRVLGDQLGTGAGQVSDEAARDARRTKGGTRCGAPSSPGLPARRPSPQLGSRGRGARRDPSGSEADHQGLSGSDS
jgi:hypothetical protein